MKDIDVVREDAGKGKDSNVASHGLNEETHVIIIILHI
jgi:hypothetical protein